MKVPVVPGLSRNKIEAIPLTQQREFQPEAFKGECPVEREEIYLR